MKKTYNDTFTFVNVARNYIGRNAKEDGKPKDPATEKLLYACRRMIVRLQNVHRRYWDKVEKIKLNYAHVDDQGIPVHEPATENQVAANQLGEYKFKKEDALKKNEEIEALADTEVEFQPYFATSLPPDLDGDVEEVFEGFVIEPKP